MTLIPRAGATLVVAGGSVIAARSARSRAMRRRASGVDDDGSSVEFASGAFVRAMGEAFRSPLPGLQSGLAGEPSVHIRRHITNAPKLISVNP
jgi:hypothetical protein